MEPKRFLNRKIVVGSAQLRSTYRMDEHAFHPSDVPQRVRAAKQQAQEWKRPSALKALSKPSWNSSVIPRNAHKRTPVRQLAINEPMDFAFNFRAEVLPAARPVNLDAFSRSQLKPATAQGDRNKPSWNSTTQGGGSEAARQAATGLLTQRARGASRARSRRLVSAQQGYLTPAERESARMVALRARRTATARSLAAGQVHTESWDAHFTSSLQAAARRQPSAEHHLPQVAGSSAVQDTAAPAWSARPSWAASAAAATAQQGAATARPESYAGTPIRRGRGAFGASGAAAQDSRLGSLMAASAGGSAAWQAGYWAAALPPTPDKAAMKEAFGDERGRLTAPSEVVAPEYTLPN